MEKLDPELVQILSSYPRLSYAKGEYLISQEDRVDFMFFLFSGSVMGAIIDVNGNEYFFNEIFPHKGINSMVALGAGLCNDTKSSFSFVALSDVVCCKIPSQVVKDYLTAHPQQLIEFISKLMANYIDTCLRLNSRTASRTIERYCKFILENNTVHNGAHILGKNYTGNEISRLLGVHPTTLSRMQSALIQAGCIKKVAEGIKICNWELIKAGADGIAVFNYRQSTGK